VSGLFLKLAQPAVDMPRQAHGCETIMGNDRRLRGPQAAG